MLFMRFLLFANAILVLLLQLKRDYSPNIYLLNCITFSDSSSGSMLEPIAAIPLNDELQQARALVVKAEEDVLSRLTDKV